MMSLSENTRDILREMGLNAYKVDAYIVLLEGGQMTAMEISREASVPYSKIYDVAKLVIVNAFYQRDHQD